MSEKANSPLLRSFANVDEMTGTLADEIVARLKSDIALRGAASFVASGGTTPGPLFDTLSERDAPWDNVWVTLSDERWIAPDQDGSNEYLVRTRLLRAKAAAARFVPLKTNDALPENAEKTVSIALAAMPRPFTVNLLGMGDDGHTASLFPHAEELEAALNVNDPALARAVHTDSGAVTGDRMSLTLRSILDSQWIVVLIKGEEKLAVYRSAMAGSDVSEMPVRAVLRQTQTPVEVFWAP
jgi:6-phosphogluconolactonase